MTIDSNVLPEQLEKILQKVQSSAHYMPNWQMEVRNVLANNRTNLSQEMSLEESHVCGARPRLEVLFRYI